jgi:hypothetical protein
MATKKKASRKKAPIVSTELLPPEKAAAAKSATVALFDPKVAFVRSEQSFVADIRNDLAASENFARKAAFIAMRIGLRLIYFRDNSPHGALEPFLKQHFEKARRTLYNYMRIADEFLDDAKLRDKRTHLLKDGKRITPILEDQLDLFISPEAKRLQAVSKKLVAWVGNRGLTQIYKDIAASHDGPMPPTQKGKKPKDKRSPRQIDEDDLREYFRSFREHWITSKAWQGLDDDELAEMETFLASASKDATALLKQRK